jgi:hypothetical protein
MSGPAHFTAAFVGMACGICRDWRAGEFFLTIGGFVGMFRE